MSLRFSLRFVCPKSCGIPFLFDLTVLQQFISFFIKLWDQLGEGKELPICNLLPCFSVSLVRSITVLWVAVLSSTVYCWSFEEYTYMAKVPSWITQFKNFFAEIFVSFWNVLLGNNLPFQQNIFSSTAVCWDSL